ncbi:MAG: M20/M25/M40 family metallo-hydrolase [Candidatus Jacksonbacteria bacterium]|jgi:tripeptide aminopeptidase|nr:M20/M25/M40 family metallo-hydrolase [Candidatus Jacksonbacteria bacterium]MBT6034377.1 M20/M25/M40 family metallo-hydrolase [Candidatus Jacksonbacteria bacterium]MBT6300972.1 M20/M25/M40 family metallo-hydrolase [Candidatus Jacksonbacteria bacterium]MBT6757120.1 M20/M25/M40 family metallo-hydrolase [Candidatus Jacksonbacteria bacterium]MBT6955186.1 M20/M25/M40 family metallo-hydrolase [Candidatus Jacksonbacteria bacterium]
MISKEQLKKTFLELIAIDGIFPYEQKVSEYVEKRLTDAGVLFVKDSFENIIAKIPGEGEAIMISTHLDIPEPAPDVKFKEKGDIIESDGSSILGADPKSGLAVLVDFLCDMAKTDPSTHVPIEALITRGEEVGLVGALNADYSKISAKIGLVLDEDGPVTQVVTKAPAYVRIDADIIGKIAHPRDPNDGVNALQIACEALNQIPWGYSTEGVTWNVGLFEAGTARNSIPGRVHFKGELRSFDTERAMKEGERIEKICKEVAEKHGAEFKIQRELEFESYELERSDPLFERLDKTFKRMNLEPNYYETFGGTDGNVFNSKGITCVPIGSGYYNAHQYSEYVDLAEMQEIAEFLKEFVSDI